ncbi:MAG: C-GCAxxG-C-C family protein [Duncaniella sp.]|nr:C-GCAxxG-C-C family protein [Duncaniella sp.]
MTITYNLEERLTHARELRAGGYNCSQCVLLSFDDLTAGCDPLTLAHIAHGFGSGMTIGDMCGAISGGVMLLGLVYPDMPRPELYAIVREFITRFEALEGERTCARLKGCGHKPCLTLITDAVELLHTMLADA